MSCPEKELRELERRHARRIADEYYKIHPDAFALRLPDMHKLTPEQEHLYHSVAAKIKTEVEERALFPSTHEKRKNLFAILKLKTSGRGNTVKSMSKK